MHGTTSQKAVLFRYYYAWHHISEDSNLQVLLCMAPHLRRQYSSGIIMHGTTYQKSVVYRYYSAMHNISEDSCLQVLFCNAQHLRRQLPSGLFCMAPHLRTK